MGNSPEASTEASARWQMSWVIGCCAQSVPASIVISHVFPEYSTKENGSTIR